MNATFEWVAPHNEASEADAEAARLASFRGALDALRKEVQAEVGDEDVAHMRRILRLSRALELTGRGLLYVSFTPLGFGLGVAALSTHKTLELMEVGHMVLHRCYDKIEGAEDLSSKTFKWKAPVDEASWQRGHNIKHHQYTNIEGRDPDLDFGVLRLSGRVPRRWAHRFQPISNVLSWAIFSNAINMHVTGLLEVLKAEEGKFLNKQTSRDELKRAGKVFGRKFGRYYAREFVALPALAGPFFGKVLLGNALSEVARDMWAGAIIYCGHVGAKEFPPDTKAKGRAQWYAMQVEAARNVKLPRPLSILAGGLDRQIEHHLFPQLPPNRLRDISPRVRAICEEHGVEYREASWPEALRQVFAELRRIQKPDATTSEPAATPPTPIGRAVAQA